MENIRKKWDEILLAVKTEFDIPNASYDTFLKKLEPYNIEGTTLFLLYPMDTDQVALNFIKRQYEVPLKFKIKEFTGIDYDLVFILPKDTTSMSSGAATSNMPQTPNYIQSNLISRFTFDTFVVGSNNRFAQVSALTVANAPGEAYNPLYIYGGPGRGKTHLMHAIGNYILEYHPNMRVLYVTCEEFTNEVIESIRSTNNTTALSKLREKYRSSDVLMIDDIQFLIGKEGTQNEFFHTFETLHQNGKQIILSSDRPPKELETLEDRIRSRFEMGLMADIGVPDYETRMAILRKKAENEKFNISDEILNYIATNIESNIRELEGAFNKLKAYHTLEHQEITIEIAQKELENIISPNKPKDITPQLIIEVVAEHYNISIEQMISKSRSAQYVKPRQVAMFLCEEMTDATKTYVGSLLGDRDHATVINGIKKITEEYNKNDDYKKEIDSIKNKISPIVN